MKSIDEIWEDERLEERARFRDACALAALPYALEHAPTLAGAGVGARPALAAAYAYTIAAAMLHERDQEP